MVRHGRGPHATLLQLGVFVEGEHGPVEARGGHVAGAAAAGGEAAAAAAAGEAGLVRGVGGGVGVLG